MSEMSIPGAPPIRVDWLPARGAGRVGLTAAPGNHATRSPHEDDLARDLGRLRADEPISADVLVSLVEPAEYARLGIPGYHEEVRRRGFELLELPIRDGGVPASMSDLGELVAQIDARLRAGQNVVIHCAGGLGRSGVVAGCLLVRQGATAAEAVAALRACRGDRCPETEAQRQLIRAFAGRPSRASRIRGAVLGAAIGDAMGHPTEFMSMPAIHQLFGPDGVRGYELWWERDGQRFAPYTDDTQMAEVVLDSLVVAKRDGLDLDRAMRRMGEGFVAWMNAPQGGHRAPGNACLAGCRALEAGTPWREAGGETAGGCGSVMRAYSFGLFFESARAESWAVEHSKLTHRDPIALAACAAMAAGMAHVMDGDAPEVVVATMIEAAGRYSLATGEMTKRAADEAEQGVAPAVTLDRLRAWAAHEAIAAAVYIFRRHPDDVAAAILEGANTPGDSDSIATLAGALVGARCGVDAVPEGWIRDLERTGELTALAYAADDALA